MKQLKNESNTTKINLVAKKKHKNMNNLLKLKSEKWVSSPLRCKQFLRATSFSEKSAIYPDPYRETSESAVHISRGISWGAY